ncbi:MAG: hypothetical protein ACPL8I_14025 [Chloroflexaceae bacterium]
MDPTVHIAGRSLLDMTVDATVRAVEMTGAAVSGDTHDTAPA